jgi:hypothetical protein
MRLLTPLILCRFGVVVSALVPHRLPLVPPSAVLIRRTLQLRF